MTSRFVSMLLTTTVLLSVSCAGSSGKDDWVELKPESETSGEEIHLQGTVRYLDIEGGLFVIRDLRDGTYNPTNLPQEFRVDGLKVEVEGRRRNDMMSIGMSGPLLDLVRIRKLATGGEEGEGR